MKIPSRAVTWFLKSDTRSENFFLASSCEIELVNQLGSGQPTEISRNIWCEISDKPTVFHLLIWSQSLVFCFKKEDLCRLWHSLLTAVFRYLHSQIASSSISYFHSKSYLLIFSLVEVEMNRWSGKAKGHLSWKIKTEMYLQFLLRSLPSKH